MYTFSCAVNTRDNKPFSYQDLRHDGVNLFEINECQNMNVHVTNVTLPSNPQEQISQIAVRAAFTDMVTLGYKYIYNITPSQHHKTLQSTKKLLANVTYVLI